MHIKLGEYCAVISKTMIFNLFLFEGVIDPLNLVNLAPENKYIPKT